MPIHRILLLPFTFLYTAVTDFRNFLYDKGIKKSNKFDLYVIGVGNLTAGGTGKTPFVELIIKNLKAKYSIAVLSRGYKRKTKGFRSAGPEDNAETLGDEPLQYFLKYGTEINVAVGEKRALAIPKIIEAEPKTEIIVLDDSFQHRSVIPDLNILLNDYSRPFYEDSVIPAGLLRESAKYAKRADTVVITKCPEKLSMPERNEIRSRIHTYTGNKVPLFFSSIRYLNPVRIFGDKEFSKNVVLFSGIANADPLEKYVKSNYNLLRHKRYSDHYSFTVKDLNELIATFESTDSKDKCLLTTEKDMVRLISIKEGANQLMHYPVFYLPIELYFLESGDLFADYLNKEVTEGLKAIGQ